MKLRWQTIKWCKNIVCLSCLAISIKDFLFVVTGRGIFLYKFIRHGYILLIVTSKIAYVTVESETKK
jgi:hypothetical protein